MATFEESFAEIYRREVGRCTATVVRLTGDLDAAEEAVSDAFATAATVWPDRGLPANPGGWLTTTARNRAIDNRRRETTRDERQVESVRLHEPAQESLAADAVDVVADDQLRLIFLCCHPEVAPDAQVALTLRLLCGLETAAIARAFLVPEPTMAQRIVRAKRRIRDKGLRYEMPLAADLTDRLGPVLATVYLVFNESHAATTGADLMRDGLADESIRLARVLHKLLPDEPEVTGLLALLLLSAARRPARLDADGEIVRFGAQDRSLWMTALMDEGQALVRQCLEIGHPGPYQVQAAIAAVHSDAAGADDTDWDQIVALYDHLVALVPTEVVRLNRAIAISETDGPASALALIDDLSLDYHHLFHATRAEMLARLNRTNEALVAVAAALELARNDVERRHLVRRASEISSAAAT